MLPVFQLCHSWHVPGVMLNCLVSHALNKSIDSIVWWGRAVPLGFFADDLVTLGKFHFIEFHLDYLNSVKRRAGI